jgi:hypothetical protein
LGKYMDKRITVKFNGGREGTSTLFLYVEKQIMEAQWAGSFTGRNVTSKWADWSQLRVHSKGTTR